MEGAGWRLLQRLLMSWIIKASPVLKLFEPLREPEPFRVGDRVRILPWEGASVGIDYEDILRTGPEGTITESLTPFGNVRVQLGGGVGI